MNENENVGEVIDGRYRLDKRLGSGGMGTVYLGYHVNVCRRVAVKILHSKDVETEDVQRFHREARAAAAIGHKGIIDIFDVGTTAWGDPYLVMEYLDGESLENLIDRQAPFDLAMACAITEQLVLSLQMAHERGIIHRDIKPGNIFLVCEGKASKPEIKLIDFGVSKISSPEGLSRLTQAGTFLGTPAYVAPEQANGDSAIDHRADLYSVGVVLYEMLTGKLPFMGNTFNELILKIVSQPPLPPHEVNPCFPREAGPFLEKALSKKSAERFQDATEMLEGLRALCSDEAVEKSLVELGTAISSRPGFDRFAEVAPDHGPTSDPQLAKMQRDPNLPKGRPVPRLREIIPIRQRQRWKPLTNTTRRTRRILKVSLGAALLLLLVMGVYLLARESAAPISSEPTSNARIEAGGLPKTTPATVLPSIDPPAEQAQENEAPSKLDEPTQAGTRIPSSAKQQEQEPGSGKPAAGPPKARTSKRRVGKQSSREPSTKVESEADSEVRRFIKGGRQTEIAKDFE